MKHTLKKIIYMLLAVFFIVVSLQNPAVAVEPNEEDEKKVYTIEDIVYNRIPIFDINVFSDTAGGKDIREDSAVGVIRTVVATWYVSIRNAVAVFLGVLLVYTGIKMAIATVASDKARYKDFLMGWLKSIIILFTINYIMVIVLKFNDVLISMFSQGSSSENLMYETIRTRAYDNRFSIMISGMFMYIVMVIIFIKFAWVYTKRTFTVLILIILAPIVSAKYAFDSAGGKRSRVFSEWLYQFSANVLIQAVHALLYTSLVSIQLGLAVENITGFIIALMFLSFMISADKIVLRIFKFDGHVQEIEKPFKKEESLAGVYYSYGAVKLAQKGAKYVGHKAKVASYSPTLRKVKNATGNVTGKVANSVEGSILALNEKLTDKINERSVTPGKSYGSIEKKAIDKLNSANKILTLKKASRRKGSAGKVAKQTLALRKEQKNAVFKSNYKFIKNDVKGVGSIILAVPVMVVNPAVGIGLAFSGKKALTENGKSHKTRKYSTLEKAANVATLGQYINRTEEKISNEKKNKKIDDTMNTMLKVNDIMDKIEKQMSQYDDMTKAEAKNVLKATYMSDVKRVNKYMTNYMTDVGNINMDVANIDEDTQDEMINYVIGVIGRGSKFGVTQRDEIIKQTKNNLRNVKYGEDRNNNMKLFAATIQNTVRYNVNGNRFSSEIKLVNELEETNNKLYKSIYNVTEDESSKVIDIENYIDNL